MKRLASVVMENGRLMAEVIRPEACVTCHACRYGRQERMLVPLPGGDYRVGDQVELNLEDGMVGRASLLAYGVPLLALVLGLFLGGLVGDSELHQALGALVMVALSVLLLKFLEPRLRKSGKYQPEVCPHDMSNDQDIDPS